MNIDHAWSMIIEIAMNSEHWLSMIIDRCYEMISVDQCIILWTLPMMKSLPAVDSNKNWFLFWADFGQRKRSLQCLQGIIHIFCLWKFDLYIQIWMLDNRINLQIGIE